MIRKSWFLLSWVQSIKNSMTLKLIIGICSRSAWYFANNNNNDVKKTLLIYNDEFHHNWRKNIMLRKQADETGFAKKKNFSHSISHLIHVLLLRLLRILFKVKHRKNSRSHMAIMRSLRDAICSIFYFVQNFLDSRDKKLFLFYVIFLYWT